jgi:hypothetical protein
LERYQLPVWQLHWRQLPRRWREVLTAGAAEVEASTAAALTSQPEALMAVASVVVAAGLDLASRAA